MSDSEDRKHQPTPLRRKKAMEQGQFARSHDLAIALGLIGAAALLWRAGPGLVAGLRGMLTDALSLHPASYEGGSGLLDEMTGFALRALWITCPLIGGMLLFGLLQSWMQSRFQFFASGLKLDVTRLNPTARIRQLFSGQNSMQLVFAVSKVTAVFTIIAFRFSRGGFVPFVASVEGNRSVEQVAAEVGYALIDVAWQAGAVLLLLGCADYAIQWYRNEQSLRMTDEELREELKESSADPALARRRRDLRAKLAD